MNSRICQLLRYVISRPGESVRLESLADHMGMSVRMIRNYCADAEKFFGSDYFCTLFVIDGSSIVFKGTRAQATELSTLISNADFYRYKLTSDERCNMIYILMLCTNDPVTISELCDMFYTSRGTLLHDIDTVRERYLDPAGIVFAKNKSHGLLLECPEAVRRRELYREISAGGLFSLFENGNADCNILHGFLGRLLKLKKNKERIQTAVHEAEDQLHIFFNDREFFSISLFLIIVIIRTEYAHFIENCEKETFSPNGFSINLAESIFRSLSQRYPFPENEIRQLAQFIKELELSCVNPSNEHESLRYYFLVRSFLLEVSKAYSVDLLTDSKLNDYLVGHMLGVYHRAKKNEKLLNPLVAQMKSSYAEDFRVVKNCISILENGLNIEINDDEIAYILMHIIVSLERAYDNMPVPDVIVACNGGLATANFLAETIKKEFSVNVVSVTSSHSIKMILSRQHADFIISTVPLDDVDLPYVCVSLPISKADSEEIKSRLDHISKKLIFQKRTEPRSSVQEKACSPEAESAGIAKRLQDLLPDSHILIDVEAADWKEAIIAAGEPLLWDNIVSVDYLSAMVSNMLENGPYFVFSPHVAIAHAHPSHGVNDLGFTLVRLCEPVAFGHPSNDPVKFVAAVSMFDNASHVNILFKIMNTLCNPDILAQLENAGSKEEIRDIVSNYDSQMKSLIPVD